MTPLLTGVFASQISGHLDTFAPAGSYDALATYTVPAGGVSSVSFTGIPTDSTYSHLQIRYFIPSTPSAGDNIYMRLGNGSIDTGSNYAWHNITGYGGGSIGGSTESNVNLLRLLYQNITEAAAFPVVGVTDILDYSSPSKRKVVRTFIGRDANSSTSAWSAISFMSGLWNNTSPITTFNITYGGGNLPQNTIVSVYGVK
jgi:hypothetical protein